MSTKALNLIDQLNQHEMAFRAAIEDRHNMRSDVYYQILNSIWKDIQSVKAELALIP